MGGGPQPLTFAGSEIRERELRRIRIGEGAPVKRNMHRTQRVEYYHHNLRESRGHFTA